MSPRPRRGLGCLVIALVLIACVAFIADRVAEAAAENKLATVAADEAAKYDVRADKTSVEIGGFGFLPQLVKGSFKTITVTMAEPTISKVPAEGLTVVMRTVDVPRELITGDGNAKVLVDDADLRARLSAGSLTRLAQQTSGLDGLTLRTTEGKLQAILEFRGIEITAAVKPLVRNGSISLTAPELPDDIPGPIKDSLNALLAKGFQVPELPFDAQLKQIVVQDGEIILTATASKVQLG